MSNLKRLFALLLILIAGGLTSCQGWGGSATSPVVKPTGQKRLPPDAVTFDVLLIQVPYHYRDLVRELWRDVDEQEIAPNVRANLYANGFRAGVIGASVPESLSGLLSLKRRLLRTSVEETMSPDSDESVPGVSSKPVTLQQGRRSMIKIWEEVIPSIPVLKNEQGDLVGKSFTDATPRMNVAIRQQPDGSVQFDLTPIIYFGQSVAQTRFQHGQMVSLMEQPSKTFESLQSQVTLRPGQFLVMGGVDEPTTGLGRYFFTRGTDDMEQKILVIRLLVTQHDEQFKRFPGFDELTKD